MRNANVYLYAVIPRIHDGFYSPHGVHSLPVSLCSQGDLSAAISFGPANVDLVDRRAHRRVMRQLLSHAAVLPAPEPTILPSLAAVEDMLSAQQQRMLDQLRRVQGLIEVRLEVFNRQHVEPDIRPAGSLPGSPGGAPGPAAQSAIAAERAYLLARHLRALRSGGFIVQSLPLRHAQAMLRLGCLLPQASLQLFASTCEALRRHLDPAYMLSVSTPMAPIDFVNPQLFQRSDLPCPPRTELASASLQLSPLSAYSSAEIPLHA